MRKRAIFFMILIIAAISISSCANLEPDLSTPEGLLKALEYSINEDDEELLETLFWNERIVSLWEKERSDLQVKTLFFDLDDVRFEPTLLDSQLINTENSDAGIALNPAHIVEVKLGTFNVYSKTHDGTFIFMSLAKNKDGIWKVASLRPGALTDKDFVNPVDYRYAISDEFDNPAHVLVVNSTRDISVESVTLRSGDNVFCPDKGIGKVDYFPAGSTITLEDGSEHTFATNEYPLIIDCTIPSSVMHKEEGSDGCFYVVDMDFAASDPEDDFSIRQLYKVGSC